MSHFSHMLFPVKSSMSLDNYFGGKVDAKHVFGIIAIADICTSRRRQVVNIVAVWYTQCVYIILYRQEWPNTSMQV